MIKSMKINQLIYWSNISIDNRRILECRVGVQSHKERSLARDECVVGPDETVQRGRGSYRTGVDHIGPPFPLIRMGPPVLRPNSLSDFPAILHFVRVVNHPGKSAQSQSARFARIALSVWGKMFKN